VFSQFNVRNNIDCDISALTFAFAIPVEFFAKLGNVGVVQHAPALHKAEHSEPYNSLDFLLAFNNNKFKTNIFISFSVIYKTHGWM
jgi:hypothetical protein